MGNSFQQPNNLSGLGKQPVESPSTDQQPGPSNSANVAAKNADYDWSAVQSKLSQRFATLTEDDFSAADGDRAAFVERLAQRQGISANEAGDDLSAFEGRNDIKWRTGGVTSRRSNPQQPSA